MLTFSKNSQPTERTERNRAHPLADRARRYVEKMPSAIEGSDGSGALFAVAVALVHGFNLPEADTWQIILEYNTRCVPPWSERELRHKLADAKCLSRHPKPRGYLRGADVEPNYRLPIPEKPERVVWEVKPKPLPGKKSQTGPQSEQAEIEELTGHIEAEPLGKPPLADPEDIEANRIAGEFMVTLAGDRWSANVLTGSAQPRTREEHTAFLMSAFDPEEVFDFSNLDDVAEFERLYRRKL
jgi:hypothetical protein